MYFLPLFRLKLMAEGELKDMEQFFDDLSDSFSGTEPEVHKTSVVGKKNKNRLFLMWCLSLM